MECNYGLLFKENMSLGHLETDAMTLRTLSRVS